MGKHKLIKSTYLVIAYIPLIKIPIIQHIACSKTKNNNNARNVTILPILVNLSFPAVELLSKNYSLEADMITGWRPKFKIVGPIPFNFDSPVLDQVIDELTSFGHKYKERVIYLGMEKSYNLRI